MPHEFEGISRDTYMNSEPKTGRALTYDMLSEIRSIQLNIQGSCGDKRSACDIRIKELENVDWEAAFDRLRWRAARVGADAVIEVMGGRIPLTIWYPPKMPTGLELSGGTAVRLVRGEAITEWALVGIAVVWKEQDALVGSRN